MIKLPTTYINGECWMDELDTAEINKLEFKLDSTGNSVVAYCSKCNTSDFYDPFKVNTLDSKCCNSKLVPEKLNVSNDVVSPAYIMDKYK